MILSPNCLRYLSNISLYLKSVGYTGLPRGLCISPTLAELYLEKLDSSISKLDRVIYSARYVDDVFLLVDSGSEKKIESKVEGILKELGLTKNTSVDKYYVNSSRSCEFSYLGYKFKVDYMGKKKGNKVDVIISDNKIKRLKSRIVVSFNDFKKSGEFSILKQRLNYLAGVKPIKDSGNGKLMSGMAYNYCHVTDGFECLKSVDGFFNCQVNSYRFGLDVTQKSVLSKFSFYGYVKNKKVGSFTWSKAARLTEVWKNV